ncbi:MAG: Maf family protein [Syntrophomonas sp.]
MKDIILASGSPRRNELLARLGLTFSVVPAQIEEDISSSQLPQELTQEIAFQKARYVSKRIKKGLIIGADTIVVLEDHLLGKPVNEEDAFNKLSLLNGKRHEVVTGLCVIDAASGDVQMEAEITRVYFRKITDTEIRGYIASGECMDKAGAYAIQGRGAIFVDRIEGCYYNVVGLPLTRLYLMLQKRGVNFWGG